ncbi:TraR/DksA C4-type zinc finger protein [Marmoricola sp. OAE513]|uniref:TraR/DksA family transcriptional regulator n=1 Tax=Marmoricola sp. OAE513 TaxID=2817894 RepID=UPI001DFF616D
MTPVIIEHVDETLARLTADRARASGRLAEVSESFQGVVVASRDSNADDEHDPEGATIAFERSQISAVAAQLLQHLAEIDGAVRRWESGTYGICERCGGQIAPGRLEARPVARTCVACV